MKISKCCKVEVFEKKMEPNQAAYFCRRCLKSCEILYWFDPLSPNEEEIISKRYLSDRKKKSVKSLAKSLGISTSRILHLEKRAAMKILKMTDVKSESLKERIYKELKAEPSVTRAKWKNAFIEQYKENKSQ